MVLRSPSRSRRACRWHARAREKGQCGDAWAGGGARLLESFIDRGRPQESAEHLFGDLPGCEFRDSSIQDGRGEERMRHAQTAGLAIKDLARPIASAPGKTSANLPDR